MALTYHSARRGFLGFLTYLTGSDGVTRGGVIPAMTLVNSAGIEAPSGTSTSPLYAVTPKETTATQTSVAAAAADTSILAANTNRLPGSTVTNDSAAIMYLLLGSGVASTTNYTVAIDAKSTVSGVFTLPDGWTGAVRAIWASATGSARVTELSA